MLHAQGLNLPEDFRQHNISETNSSLGNPVFSTTRNAPSSLAFWSRWQWQTVDGDPTTFLINFTGNIDTKSAFGVGFLQHNTGLFLNTGGLLNYSYTLQIQEDIALRFGINIFGYQRELANDVFVNDPDSPIPPFDISNDFILQFGPGIGLTVADFTLALASENLITRNLSEDEDFDNRTFLGMVSYNFPLELGNFAADAVVRPSLYVKTIPNADTQIGAGALISSSKFWLQGGYNSFYGISAGLGGRVFKKFSLGVLVEFGTSGIAGDEDPSFEIVSSYRFKEPKRTVEVAETEDPLNEEKTENVVQEDPNNAQKEEERLAKEKQLTQQREDSIATAKREEAKARKALQEAQNAKEQERLTKEKALQQQREDSIATAKLTQEKLRIAQEKAAQAKEEEERLQNERELLKKQEDSIAAAKLEQAKIAANLQKEKEEREQKRKDSIAIVEKQRAVVAERIKDSIRKAKLAETSKTTNETKTATAPKTKGRYEEITNEDGLAPGYYLIANVFGTKKYFEAFMLKLTKDGLNPRSFYRKVKKYNYVYLERYDSLQEAERARDSQFNGKYTDKTWIFRVKN